MSAEEDDESRNSCTRVPWQISRALFELGFMHLVPLANFPMLYPLRRDSSKSSLEHEIFGRRILRIVLPLATSPPPATPPPPMPGRAPPSPPPPPMMSLLSPPTMNCIAVSHVATTCDSTTSDAWQGTTKSSTPADDVITQPPYNGTKSSTPANPVGSAAATAGKQTARLIPIC
nr:hypothetical protein Iba_chr01cCG3680 [Ipomoea batatas]